MLPVTQQAFNLACSTLAMIGEFGGIGAFVKGKEWWPNACHTYLPVKTPSDEANTYISMVEVRHAHLTRQEGGGSVCRLPVLTTFGSPCDFRSRH